ncbi:MAG TPA: RNA polymerase sigma-70 factor [Gemmatimonadaceae bacterium]|nr:RNA polymerase sigma-70 factor [Gemmatimonadaceae bacterium]
MPLAHAAHLDSDLIARIRAGDESAFEQLFHRYYRELCVHASRIDRAGGTAEEIVQEVFFRIWMHRERLLPVESLSGYLYAAVRNVALNRLARARTEERWRAAKQVDALDARTEAPAADAEMRETEMAMAIDRAIGELPPRCREAFLLRRQRQLSYAEIAQAMGTSQKTVEIQIGKALRLLRKSLAEWL